MNQPNANVEQRTASVDDPKLSEQYEELIGFYTNTVKPIITASEKVDPKQRLNESAIVEVRSAFDHVMRAHSVIYGIVDAETIKKDTGLEAFDYCNTNLKKAFAHLYRAAYDAYDVISISYETRIHQILDSVSPDALYEVVKDAQATIFASWNSASELMTNAKIGKDVESKEAEKAQFEAYEDGTKRLKAVFDALQSRLPAITAYADNIKQINGTLGEFSQEVICDVVGNDCAQKIYLPLADAKERIQDPSTSQEAVESLREINRYLQALVPAFAKRKKEIAEKDETATTRHNSSIRWAKIAVLVSVLVALFGVYTYYRASTISQEPPSPTITQNQKQNPRPPDKPTAPKRTNKPVDKKTPNQKSKS